MAITGIKKRNLTEGPIFSRIILFALPLMASNLLQMLYNAADMMVVGLSPVTNAVGAIGMSASYISLIIQFLFGLSVGSNVVVARGIGANDEKAVSKATHTAVSMGLIFGVALGAVGCALARPVQTLMGAEGDLLNLASKYTIIYLAGSPFLALTNYLASIFRAKGDTRTPLIVLAVSGVVNVLLNLFFVLVVGLSVEGVAIATVAANVCSAVVLLIILSRDNGPCKFSLKKLCVDKKAFKDILYVGAPAGIQSSLFALSNMLIQSSIIEVNNLHCPTGGYDAIVEGNAAAANIESFAFTAANAVTQSTITFVGQNAGAKKHKRVVKIAIYGHVCAVLIGLLFTAAIFLLKEPLLALYSIPNADSGIEALDLKAGITRITWHLLPFAIFAFMDTSAGIAKALKRAIPSTIIALVGTCLLRVVWIFTGFRYFLNLESIYVSYPVSWLITGAAQLILIIYAIRSDKKEAVAQASPTDESVKRI